MKASAFTLALMLINPLACLAGAPGDGIVARLNRIVFPVIDWDDITLSEAVDYMAIRNIELDPERDPSKKGVSIIIKSHELKGGNNAPGNKAAVELGLTTITYSAKSVPFTTLLAEIARRANLDVYVTGVGIVICQGGDTPFPNSKAEKGEVWETIYKSKATPTQPRRGEQPGADQPATAPESKSEGKQNPQPESKPAPR